MSSNFERKLWYTFEPTELFAIKLLTRHRVNFKPGDWEISFTVPFKQITFRVLCFQIDVSHTLN